MIKVIVVDDEEPARLRMKRLLSDFTDQLQLVGEADCGKAAILKIEKLRPDAVFLDIQMPDFSGFEVLSKLSYQPLVIFITAYTDYAIKAFETLSIDYLVKPVEEKRFKKAIEKLLKLGNQEASFDFKKLESILRNTKPEKQVFSLPIKKRDRIVLVDLEEISYLKAEDKYVQVFLNDGSKHLINKSISQLEEELPKEFIRVHRSFIVNRNFIFEIEKYFKGNLILKLKDAPRNSVTTGETYTAHVKKLLGL